jgi:hypothetical protein
MTAPGEKVTWFLCGNIAHEGARGPVFVRDCWYIKEGDDG